MTRQTVVFVNRDGSTATSYIALSDHHEVALDLWLQAEPCPAELEQEVRDRGGYDYPVPAADER